MAPRAVRYLSSERACGSDGRSSPAAHRATSAGETASLAAAGSMVLRRVRSVLVSSAPKTCSSAVPIAVAPGLASRVRDSSGLLALIHPVDRAPKALVLNRVIPFLSRLLAEYNAGLSRPSQPERQLRIRVVMHAGEVHYDANGCFGEALDVAFRLLDAARVKRRSGRGPIRWYWWSPGISTARSCAMATTASIVRPFTSSCGSSWRASGTWAGSRCPNRSRGTTWLKWLATGVPPGLVTRVRTSRRTLINCRHRGV